LRKKVNGLWAQGRFVRGVVAIVLKWQQFGWAGNVVGFLRQGENLPPDRFDAISEFGIAITGRRRWCYGRGT
jgi:hypothetical protein